MSDALFQTILQLLGGGIIGFIIAVFTIKQQKTKKKIAYKTKEIKLLRLHENTPDTIKVTVDKSVITEKEEDRGQNIPVKSAIASMITFKNKGNSLAEDVYIDIEFNPSAKILSFSSVPQASEAYDLRFEKITSEQNTLRVYVPYLNQNHSLELSVITTDEESSQNLKVRGQGKDVDVYAFTGSFPIFLVILLLSLGLMFISMVLFEKNFVTDTLSSYVPSQLISFLGGTKEMIKVEVVSFSSISKTIILSCGVAVLAAAIVRAFYKNKF